jgi:hypothetical protein
MKPRSTWAAKETSKYGQNPTGAQKSTKDKLYMFTKQQNIDTQKSS